MNTPETLDQERLELSERLERWLEIPLIVLGLVWLVLLVIELTGRLTPVLEMLGTAIWVVFGLEFLLRFGLAPSKTAFLKQNWLTLLALLLPALRVLRVARAVRLLQAGRAARGLRLFRVITGLNRGMGALGASMSRRGFGYVVALTALVTLVGAAGMSAFEREAGLPTYGAALWWTAMIMTTMGSEYWPQTGEGRVLCLLLSLYAFAVFGYVTATLASFFVGRDAESPEAEVAGSVELRALRDEIAALRAELAARRE